MSEIDTESIDVPEPEIPSKEEMLQHFNELESRGVPAEAECLECEATFELDVLPEKNDGPHFSMCKSCMESHLREQGVL